MGSVGFFSGPSAVSWNLNFLSLSRAALSQSIGWAL